MVKLGDKVEDKISGFIGTVAGRCEYLFGSPRVWVIPSTLAMGSLSEKRDPKGEWFEESRLAIK